MLTEIYRKYISQEIRDKIYNIFLGNFLYIKRNFCEVVKMKFYRLFHRLLPDTEKNRCRAFMGKYGLRGIPYPFVLEYDIKTINCLYDEQLAMHYVVHEKKKLYFPSTCKKAEIASIYRGLLAEQDMRSPHQYVKDVSRLSGKTLFDIGAAEGFFSLNVIEMASYIYLFECEPNWIKALEATFAPWKDRVEIISKFVSDTDDEHHITIDYFWSDKGEKRREEGKTGSLFLKMDIEGYEQAALRGAKNTFNGADDIDFSIATYHRKNAAEEIAQLLTQYHQECEFTDGLFYSMLKCNKGLRKAIIRKLQNPCVR